jgi:hypothetical protein
MKSVCICCSRRFEKEVRKFARDLNKLGVVVYEPILNKDRSIDTLTPNMKRFAFLGLTHHHFSLIKKSDVVYIYNKGGYMGVSSTLELGYAEALGKPVYAFSDEDTEPVRKVLFDAIIKTPKELVKLLK